MSSGEETGVKNKVSTETVPKAVKAADRKKEGKEACLMYLGPTITDVVRHGTVFKAGNLPDKAKECIKLFPMLGMLFVELDKVPEAARKIRKEQGAFGEAYAQAAEKFTRRT